MRLAAKLVLVYLIGLLLIVGLFSYLTIQNERRLAAALHQQQAADIIASMSRKLESVYRSVHPREELQQVLRQTTSLQTKRMKMRLVEPGGSGSSAPPPGVPIDVIVTQRSMTTISMPDPSGEERLYTYVPIAGTKEFPRGTIEVSAPDNTAKDRLHRSLMRSAIAILGVTVLSGVVVLFGGILMVGKPLKQLISKVHQVGEGNFDGPLDVKQNDELGRLGVAINQMCEQLKSQRQKIDEETAARIATVGQLRHADRLSTLGRLAAGVAHEMGTPLNVVSGRAELIASGELSSDQTRRSALTIKQESDRIAGIIRSLLDFARRGNPNRDRADLAALVDETVTMMRPLAEKKNVDIRWTRTESPMISKVDSGQIRQVLTNLIVNAISAMDGQAGDTITISARSAKSDDPSVAPIEMHQIDIVDNGHGIEEEHLESIFEPFFTTKDVGEGTGLGLSIAHGIIEDHEGRIEVSSVLGEGTRFSVLLPVDEADEILPNQDSQQLLENASTDRVDPLPTPGSSRSEYNI
ncbi:HAMP domain-containing histidine kinase [Rubripirellula amarantea]|nr:HAMP domain-containing histidine kinase [Rubripirellula amarantea]